MSERTPVLEVEDIAVQFATSRGMFDGIRGARRVWCVPWTG